MTDSNPFAARFVLPGAIPYVFPPGITAERLVGRLAELGWWGQIVGAHGSGKSALLAAIRMSVCDLGRRVVSMELHDGQRRPPRDVLRDVPSGDVLSVVDGYEQLSRVSRWRLKRRCRRRDWGLLVTSHVSVGLPDLLRTASSVALAEELVHSRLGDHAHKISAEEIRRSFDRHEGNLREVLFEMYDLYEDRTSQ